MIAAILFGSGFGGHLPHVSASHHGAQACAALDEIAQVEISESRELDHSKGAHLGAHCCDAHCCPSVMTTRIAGLRAPALGSTRYLPGQSSLVVGLQAYPPLRPPIAIA